MYDENTTRKKNRDNHVILIRGVREGGSGGSSGPPWRRTVNGVGL